VTQHIKVMTQQNVPANFEKFERYLQDLGLPIEGVLANVSEREIMGNNLPQFILSLSPEVRKNATYLSKFVAGTAIGLYDASLNYIWNEVVVNLRRKIIIYGLDIFYDSAVGGKLREFYSKEEDLSGIKDNTLLDTCRKLEIISDLVHKKLNYILMMRNDIGASHPNEYSINSFELLGWLQTCVTEVINDVPSEAAIAIKSLIENLKRTTDVLDSQVISQIENSVRNLSSTMTGNLIVTLFGLFTNENSSNILKQNIIKIAPEIWSNCTDNVKYELGIKLDKFKVNLYKEKLEAGEKFFEACDGNRYKSTSARTIIVTELTEQLLEKHHGWDNFYHEAPIARELMSYIVSSEDIPTEREEKMIKTILRCRIGRGIQYNNGVSPGGRNYYNLFFEILNEKQIIIVLKLLEESSINGLLQSSICKDQLDEVLTMLSTDLLSDRIKEVLDYLKQNITNIQKIVKTKPYLDLTKSIFNR